MFYFISPQYLKILSRQYVLWDSKRKKNRGVGLLNVYNIKLVLNALRDEGGRAKTNKEIRDYIEKYDTKGRFKDANGKFKDETARRIVNRILKDYLMEWDLVEKIGDRWVLKPGPWQEYRTWEEYMIKLEHSRDLFRRAGIDYTRENPIIYTRSLEYPPILEHLKRGYPEIYELYREWKEVTNEDIVKAEGEFRREINRIANKRGFVIVDLSHLKGGRQLSHLIYRLVENNVWLAMKGFEISIEPKWEDGYLTVQDYRLAKDKELKNEIKSLLDELIFSDRVLRAFEMMDEARRRTRRRKSDKRDKYENSLKNLARKLYQGKYGGEPLRGYCSQCPRVTIGRNRSSV